MTTTPSDLVAAQIQRARQRRGWSAKDLASRCAVLGAPHLTAAVIANIETGRRDASARRRRELTIDEMFAIALALDVTPADLLSSSDDEKAVQVTTNVLVSSANLTQWLKGEASSVVPTLLGGLALCGTCGTPLMARRDELGSIYFCGNRSCPSPVTDCPADLADQYISTAVLRVLQKSDSLRQVVLAKDIEGSHAGPLDAEMVAIENEVHLLMDRRKRAQSAFANLADLPEVDPDYLAHAIMAFDTKIDGLWARRAEMERRLLLERYQGIVEDIWERKAPLADRRSIVEILMTVGIRPASEQDGDKRRRYLNVDDISIEWHKDPRDIRHVSGLGGASMARIEWSRLSGNEVEAVLGVLLCREHPTATRVKASRGDGGIDVWVPEGDAATVFQIKGYAGNIDSTRKRHIKSSWKTLLAYVKESSITLSAWYLVTPENPTKEQLSWFRGLTQGVAFPCVWRGLDFVDGLAAKYPEVIDYYLRDGKDRLEATVQRLLSIAGLNNPAASPASSIDSLKELHEALNQFDPHFYYDFSVETLNVDGTCPPVQVTPGTIAAVRLSDNGRCITYKIISRFNEALKERPVPGSMTLSAEPGSPLQEQIEDWAKFGTPLREVPAKNVRWDLPGGFASSHEEARVSVGASKPEPGSVNESITLRVLESDGTVAASLDFVTEEVSAGLDRQGVRNVGHDKEAGLIRYELRMRRDSSTGQIASNINITVEDPTGLLPGDMLPGLRFIAALRPPRRIQMLVRNGPALTPPLPVEGALVPEEQGKLWLLMCESLATIQQHVIEQIKFPDMARYPAANPMDDIEEWYQAARLLRGEVLPGTWNAVGFHLNPGQEPPPAELQQGIFSNYYSVRVGTKNYQLGIVTMQVATVRVDATCPPVVHGDHMDMRFVPGDDDTMTIRMVSSASATGSPEPLPSSS